MVDAVHICLPNRLHYPVAKYCLEQEVHCLVEKPMTIKKHEGQDLIVTASEQGCILQVGHILRFSNLLNQAKKVLPKIGELCLTTIEWSSTPTSASLENGVVLDLLPHTLDIVQYAIGTLPVKHTYLSQSHIYPTKKPTIALIGLQYTNFLCDICLFWSSYIKKRMVTFVGTEGMLSLDFNQQTLQLKKEDKEKTIPVQKNDFLYDEIKNFLYAINNGKNKKNSHMVGVQNTEIIEQILQEKIKNA